MSSKSNGGFSRDTFIVNGIKTEVLQAGSGEPLVFLHGAGTVGGFDYALAWADRFRVIIAHHPGWGGSEDAPWMNTMQDYVMHHLELLDMLGIDEFNLVGTSMGGWMASLFASQQAHRIKRLVLVAPAGLRDKAHPTTDIFMLKPDEVLPNLVHDVEAFQAYLPEDQTTIDYQVEQYREQASFARIAWDRAWDPKLPKWLHRINVPTMLLWGEEDRIVPFGQAASWAGLIPEATVRSLPKTGHIPLRENADAVRAVQEFLA